MHEFILLGLEVVIFVLFGLTGVIFKMVFAAIKNNENQILDIEKTLHNHKLHAAENFATKTDLEKSFERIMTKLDGIEVKIDRKVDKNV